MKRTWKSAIAVLLAIAVSTALMVSASFANSSEPVARTYFVDNRSGSDEGTGKQSSPWQSLERLGKVVFQPGDTIFFVAGSAFEGGFAVNQSGTSNAPITLTWFGKGAPPRFTNPHAATLDGNAIRINASNVVVDGLFFERCPTNPTPADVHTLGAVFLTTNASYCTVRNCEMTQTPIGITVYGEHNLITKNYIHDNNAPIQPHWGPMGIVICGSHNEISYNRIENYSAESNEYGHDGGAIEINDRDLPKEDIAIHHNRSRRNQGFIEWVGRVKQDNFRIHHNDCMDYQSFLGLTGPCTNFRVDHNTVVRILAHKDADSEDVIFWNYDVAGKYANTNLNFQDNIFVYDASRVEPVFARAQFNHSYNLFYRLDHGSIPKQANPAAFERKYLGGGAILNTGDKIGDPLFRDLANGDFHLRTGSPAIGAGKNLGYKKDFDGITIPLGTPPDMGAFEFVSSDGEVPRLSITGKSSPPESQRNSVEK